MIKQLAERLISQQNLNRAYLKVYRNKGIGGTDGIDTEQLKDHLQTYGQLYIQQIVNGKYQVNPILGIEIPKSNGKTRLLGIPTVVDRVFQQALHQVLQPIFEPDFQKHSYGFRPNRNAHQA